MLRAFKFWLILLLLVIFGAGIYFAMRYYRNQNDLAGLRQYEKYVEMLKSDAYGGKTPEETLKMFVDALKEGDVEKAALYFTLDDNGSRERWVTALRKDKDEGKLANIIKVFSQISLSSLIANSRATYEALNDDGLVKLQVILIYNGNVWKIESL